ncbi:hypothetical protein TW95_gp1141 [Pandoravirus inopinatum]|uniref:Uncharacterized protein n=1 Tax=Pandoravirus inopinatum TaxID=1605721 RepID=A0A0B5J7K3_9VIRU|nr:hypothetical protein TW95_gp1141 [Pandoravirus inopinatum]AJF97875.1 hypothetical protein [Pandoravirus inopinatum]
MASEAATTTQTATKTGKGMKPAKVAKILEAYRAVGIPWDSLAEPVQDALIQDLMRYYDRWCKCVCRACGCQSKDHMGARNGCPAIGNTRPLSIVRIIDLCCNAAHEKREVSAAVRAAIATGVGPLADPGVKIQYTRPTMRPTNPNTSARKRRRPLLPPRPPAAVVSMLMPTPTALPRQARSLSTVTRHRRRPPHRPAPLPRPVP